MTVTTVTQRTIPYGYAGSMSTLARMRAMVRQSITQALVVENAHRIISYFPPRDQLRYAWAIREYMEKVFRFVPDPRGVELLRTPAYQLGKIVETGVTMGDCDDAAILGAALGLAVGLSAKFRVLAFKPGAEFAHVFTILTPNNGSAIDLDVTKPAQGAAVAVRSQDYPV